MTLGIALACASARAGSALAKGEIAQPEGCVNPHRAEFPRLTVAPNMRATSPGAFPFFFGGPEGFALGGIGLSRRCCTIAASCEKLQASFLQDAVSLTSNRHAVEAFLATDQFSVRALRFGPAFLSLSLPLPLPLPLPLSVPTRAGSGAVGVL